MECSIKGEKIQAMKNYMRDKFLYNFLYLLASLITFLLMSHPFWFPSMEQLLFFLKNNISSFLSPKSFFIVGNLIVWFLIRESKLTHSSHSSPTSDIYDEYVARSHGSYCKVNSKEEIRGATESLKIEEKNHGNVEKIHHNEEKKKVMRVCKSTIPREEKKKVLRICKSEVCGESENVKREKKTKGKREEQHYIPREELNKRVEAFIARVNKRRLLEEKLVNHYRG